MIAWAFSRNSSSRAESLFCVLLLLEDGLLRLLDLPLSREDTRGGGIPAPAGQHPLPVPEITLHGHQDPCSVLVLLLDPREILDQPYAVEQGLDEGTVLLLRPHETGKRAEEARITFNLGRGILLPVTGACPGGKSSPCPGVPA